MSKLIPVSITNLLKYENSLKLFSDITELQIQDIWIKKGEPSDITDIMYDYNIPLYQKMILRYRNGGHLTTRLFTGCDPNNQNLLLLYFNMKYNECHNMIDFFVWISESLSILDVLEFEGLIYSNKNIEQSKYIKSWKKNNIRFFYSLPHEDKQKLIRRYNIECVENYNRYLELNNINQ
jgi:hypothetical protein